MSSRALFDPGSFRAPAVERAAAASLTLLESGFPFREISILSQADRRGRDPSYDAHRWWARRPPSVVRAILLAAFLRPSARRREFWDLFRRGGAHLAGRSIHDPFVGGGSTLLEASRLGATATGTDIDPLACLITRQLLDPPDPVAVHKYAADLGTYLHSEVGALYEPESARWTPLHWFWIYLVLCPACGVRTPLYRSLRIARHLGKAGAVVRDSAQIAFCPDCLTLHRIKSPTATHIKCCGRRELSEATFTSHKFHCPSCSHRTDHTALKTLTTERRMLAVEETHPKQHRRIRSPRPGDYRCLVEAERFLRRKRQSLAIPKHPISADRRDPRPISYGARIHADLFHPRQLATFGAAFAWIAGCDADVATKSALRLATSHALTFNNRLCGYATDYGRLAPLFSVRSYCLPILSVELLRGAVIV